MTYEPTRTPVIRDVEELRRFLDEELQRLSESLQRADFSQLRELHVEPKRPRDGMIVYADGTDWNPGSGEGFYGRENGAWVKL